MIIRYQSMKKVDVMLLRPFRLLPCQAQDQRWKCLIKKLAMKKMFSCRIDDVENTRIIAPESTLFLMKNTEASRARDEFYVVYINKRTPISRMDMCVGSNSILEEKKLPRVLMLQKQTTLRQTRNAIDDEPVTESKLASIIPRWLNNESIAKGKPNYN